MRNKPRIHITMNAVRSLRISPPNEKHFIWDDEVRGFGVYRNSGGNVIFVYQYRMPHQPARRMKIGEFGELTPTQARDIARDLAYERRQSVDPAENRLKAAREAEAARSLTLGVYVENYIQRRNTEERPLSAQHERILRYDVAGLMPDVRIDRMTTTEIDGFLKKLQERSKSARLFGLLYLKVILNDAKSRSFILRSPADAYELPKRVERERVLRPDEVQRIVEAARDMNDNHGKVVEVLLRTFRRKEEVAAMTWEEINQDGWIWTIPASRMKNKQTYVMELPSQVISMFQLQQPDRRKRTGWMFTFYGDKPIKLSTQSKNTLDAHIHRRMELAVAKGAPPRPMEHWTFHDLRTTAATLCGYEPLSIREEIIELCLGHATPKNRKSKYQRGEMLALTQSAFQSWNDYLDELMQRPDAWPGGRYLERIPIGEIKPRRLKLHQDWPKKPRHRRTD
jgi:integrase